MVGTEEVGVDDVLEFVKCGTNKTIPLTRATINNPATPNKAKRCEVRDFAGFASFSASSGRGGGATVTSGVVRSVGVCMAGGASTVDGRDDGR
jgi:hypothetical protein